MIHYEDLTVGDTVELGPTSASAEEMIAFAKRYDPQPFHLSDEGAADTYFGRLAASGWHTAALTMRLMMTGRDEPLASLGSPGFENLRWRKPVYPDDQLTALVTVASKRLSESRPEMGLVQFEIETRNQDGVVVMSFVSTSMMARREPG
ncbi:cyanate lyase protein [Salinisphaera shabanensis E1L3A]|uniref:Cyanate lyase protein n=1 Tax=Salinisphaera shabanensis E1L3A TaxID=1033802 RepID=U2EAQ2_9GAMM|nr:MaoC family dehydratase [Salinisphaera shabanensis]ERJ20736.1 cyanate lyase protein [Salinisphaera shabanensis E1L3A]